MTTDKRIELWDQFLDRWSIEALEKMTIDDYIEGGNNKDSFSYWLEFKTKECLGIGGGSAYKLGIFKFKSQGEHQKNNRITNDGTYGWNVCLGSSSQEAFQTIKSSICQIATLAQQGQLEQIETLAKARKLPNSLVWKTAFFYQPLDNLTIPAFVKKEWLEKYCNTKGLSFVELYKKSAPNMKSREELYALTDKIWNIVNKRKNNKNEEQEEKNYWLMSLGVHSSIAQECFENNEIRMGWDEAGNLSKIKSKDEIDRNGYSFKDQAKNMLWDFAKEMQIGDLVLVKDGFTGILGWGIVSSEYQFIKNSYYYSHVRKVKWENLNFQRCNFKIQKTLTRLHGEKLKLAKEIIENNNKTSSLPPPLHTNQSELSVLTIKETSFLADCFLSDEKLNEIVALLNRKKNIILAGAPGIGKTYLARRLCKAILGSEKESNIKMVQFHQNYSYEDFMLGYRPDKDNFKLQYGPFYQFCKEAENNPSEPYFFIIDEINRGKISKIFGELLMLIEHDKRGIEKCELVYRDDEKGINNFSVPKNIFIIGMMNTADRSIAMLDYALRRRFAYIELEPAFNSEKFEKYKAKFSMNQFEGSK